MRIHKFSLIDMRAIPKPRKNVVLQFRGVRQPESLTISYRGFQFFSSFYSLLRNIRH